MSKRTVSSTSKPGKQTPADTRTRMERFAPHLPCEDFPLTPHPSGRWCKKNKQVQYYYGKLADGWEAALEAFNKYFEAYDSKGLKRPAEGDDEALTVGRLCDHYYEAKRKRHEAGELAYSSLCDYDETCNVITAAFGKNRLVSDIDARDFAALRASLAKRLGPVALGNEINRVRMVFNFAFKNGLTDRPARFGTEFARPSRKVLRLHKAAKPVKLLTAAEIRKLAREAGVPLEAMIWLGINCGLGNKDVSDLNRAHLDLDGGWLNFPRQKTGVARRCPLWPETVRALKAALRDRPEPKGEADADAVFVTRHGQRWVRGKSINAVTNEFVKLLDRYGMKREGIAFYVLRHVHRTIADEAKDQRAAGVIMGHEDAHISSAYVERVSDDRLLAVSNHVRAWLLEKPAKGKGAKSTKAKVNKGEKRPPLRIAG